MIFALATPDFATVDNLRGILASVAVLGIIALGVNQVVLAGDIDISVGSMLGRVRDRRRRGRHRRWAG